MVRSVDFSLKSIIENLNYRHSFLFLVLFLDSTRCRGEKVKIVVVQMAARESADWAARESADWANYYKGARDLYHLKRNDTNLLTPLWSS